MRHIRFCRSCGAYTLKEECCGAPTILPRPAKYSPDDKYASYRRKAKERMTHDS